MNDWVSLTAENREQGVIPELSASVENSALAKSYFQFYGIDFESRFEGLKHHFGLFSSTGFEIAAQVFVPENPKKTVFIYHGYYDHVGLMRHAIEFCLEQDFAVFAYDLPGHGLSTGARAEIDSFDLYLDVLHDAFDAAAPFNLPAEKIAIAQSTGGAILMTYLLKGGNAFDKVVLLAPLVRPNGWTWGKPLHNLIGNMISSLPRNWQENSGDLEFIRWLKDEDILQPKVLPMSWVGALKVWEPGFHELPPCLKTVLVIQGDADETVDWRFNIPAVTKQFPNAVVSHLSGARHHLVNEKADIRAKIWARVSAYLNN